MAEVANNLAERMSRCSLLCVRVVNPWDKIELVEYLLMVACTTDWLPIMGI